MSASDPALPPIDGARTGAARATVGVVIVNYNRGERLQQQVEPLVTRERTGIDDDGAAVRAAGRVPGFRDTERIFDTVRDQRHTVA